MREFLKRLLPWPRKSTSRPASARAMLGAGGEKRAARHVKKSLGYKVLARNVKCPGGELDIIALDGNDLVIIEVRSRSQSEFGAPESSVRHDKRRFLLRSGQWFQRSRRLELFTLRFDLIAIDWPTGGEPTIRHHRNFMPAR
jgi:putative endonuclease